MQLRNLTVAALLVSSLPIAASAQNRSEKASVMQEIAGVTVTIDYYRPVARGREKLFGGVVHWGETWTPGANWATTLDVSRDFTLNGRDVPKGKYSMWMVPAEQGDWTVFLNKTPKRFHTQRPKGTDEDIVRFTVAPQKGPHMEVLTFYFPLVTKEGATLHMQWGETVIPLALAIGKLPTIAWSAEQRASLIGEYLMETKQPGMDATPPRKFIVFEKNGEIFGRFDPNPNGMEVQFVPIGSHELTGTMVMNGQKTNTLAEPFTLVTDGGKVKLLMGDFTTAGWRGEKVK